MIKLIKRLFCNHDYKITYLHMTEGGVRKVYQYSCKKCGRVKADVV